MKVVHLCLACFYVDNHSYQENLLPKYHKELGYDVEIIASLETFDQHGEKTYIDTPTQYYNENGIKVTRLDYSNMIFSKKFKKYKNTYLYLEEAEPDVIFVHGSQFLDLQLILKYCEAHPHVKLYIDNHADFSNSATNLLSRLVLHRVIWKSNIQKSIPYVEKYYGVLPARVDFLTSVYNIPENKVELLVMGVDPEYIDVSSTQKQEIFNKIKKRLNIKDNDFVIITGGKIDNAKKEILMLMDAVNEMEKDVKLVVFGSVTENLKELFNEKLSYPSIKYVGWLNSKETYEYLLFADLAVFPGRHSVLWEQAVGTGLPGVFKYWPGTTHVNVNSNAVFLHEPNKKSLKESLENILDTPELYLSLKKNAESAKINFSYLEIAKQSLK